MQMQVGRMQVGQSGAALLEFAMVLPVLFILFFGALETVRVLETKNTMSMYAREAANLVFTECIELDRYRAIDGAPSTFIPDCVLTNLQRIEPSRANISPNTTLIVTVYFYEAGQIAQVTQQAIGPGAPSLTLYHLPGGGPGVDPTFVGSFQKVVIAETFSSYNPVVYLPMRLNLYDVAIY